MKGRWRTKEAGEGGSAWGKVGGVEGIWGRRKNGIGWGAEYSDIPWRVNCQGGLWGGAHGLSHHLLHFMMAVFAAFSMQVLTSTKITNLQRSSSGKLVLHLESTADPSSSSTSIAAAPPAAAGAVPAPPTAAAAAAGAGGPEGQAEPTPVAPGGVATAVAAPVATESPPAAPADELEATLVLGCDGIKSLIRKTLADWTPGSFEVEQYPSLSSGIRYKVLQLPPNPTTADGMVLINSSFAVLIGRPTKLLPAAPALRLGLLPVRDPTAGRTANLNVLPDHPIWEVHDAKTMYEVFEDAFPQVKWRELVPMAVMEKYAASTGGTFPAPQYCTALTWDAEELRAAAGAEAGKEEAGVSGVVLLGDAAHCFPPDLGQGVNSSLEDVCVLEKALEESGDRLGEALKMYQQRRQEDTAALAKLVQVGWKGEGGVCGGLCGGGGGLGGVGGRQEGGRGGGLRKGGGGGQEGGR